ncbi:hypothetical protein [Streptomyces sp. NPDC096013]|uniref:hypothetical protein n=1 Tax=Streptomyces sp. NPDC096013 TaxID=3366069 RepID=UPI00381A3798
MFNGSAGQVPAAGVGGGSGHLGDQQGAVVGGLEDVDEQGRQDEAPGPWSMPMGRVPVAAGWQCVQRARVTVIGWSARAESTFLQAVRVPEQGARPMPRAAGRAAGPGAM